MNKPLRIGIVSPRFGPRVYGGAEIHARELARLLTTMGHAVDVVTTTADDANTWLPGAPSGSRQEDGYTVRRFDPMPRHWLRYDRNVRTLETGTISAEELDQLDEDLGKSPELLDYLRTHRDKRDWWVFIPYLFSPTVDGLPLVDRSILIPCLHDESLARRPKVARVFEAASHVWYNTLEEAELGQRLFGRQGDVVGLGFQAPATPMADLVDVRRVLNLPPRYLLYMGRLESGKGLGILLAWYTAYRKVVPCYEEPATLVVAGSGEWRGQWPDGVKVLASVSEPTKWALYSGALAYCLPSIVESLSISIMDAWLMKTPVLVRAGSPVTCGHIRRSGGGFVVESAEMFAGAVTALDRMPGLRDSLARHGHDYVRREYSWDSFEQRVRQALKVAVAEDSIDAH